MLHLLIVAVGALTPVAPHWILLHQSGTAIIHFEPDQQNWSTERAPAEAMPPAFGDKAPELQSWPEVATTEQLAPVPVDPSLVEAERIKLILTRLPGHAGSMLFVVNGYAKSFAYHAVLHRGDVRIPTKVCSVAGHVYGAETWYFDVDAIELGDFILLDGSNPVPVCS